MRGRGPAHSIPANQHAGIWPKREPAGGRGCADLSDPAVEQAAEALRHAGLHGWRWQTAGGGGADRERRHPICADGARSPYGATGGVSGRRSQKEREMTKRLVVAVWVATAAASVASAGDVKQLLNVRRVYVDRLTGGETAAQMRDILISSLAASELFIVTENQEHADTILRGAAEDLVFTDVHQSSDSINAHANLGTSRGGGTYASRSANSL